MIKFQLEPSKNPNFLFETGKVPAYCTLTKTNYRPITILPVLSKVFKKLVHTLKMFIIIMSLHIEITMDAIDNHKVISLVSMDLSRTFDTLPHDLIVKKLEDYGRDSKVINLVTNYLSDRQQRVRLSGQYSSMKTIMKGVFQGSILGPILF